MPSDVKFDLIVKNRRSIRQFNQLPIPHETLVYLVRLARFAPSGSNRQPLKYIVVDEPALVARVFPLTKWAGWVTPRRTPAEGRRPVAWIVVLADQTIKKQGYEKDVGAAVQTMLLAAYGEGIGTCWIGSVDRKRLRALLRVPKAYAITDVVALGFPAESPQVEDVNPADDSGEAFKYYLDADDVLHVPKRRLDAVLFENAFPDD